MLASVRPAMLMHLEEGAHEYLVSSPWARSDAHHDYFERGDNENQIVAHAPTWVANPTQTPELCQRLADEEAESGEESDFDRDYAANPMGGGASDFYDGDIIDMACELWGRTEFGELRDFDVVTAGADMGMVRNSSALAMCAQRDDLYLPFKLLEKIPTPGEPLKPSVVAAEFAGALAASQCKVAMSDAHYRESLREACMPAGIVLLDAPMQPEKPHVRFRQLLRGGRVPLPPHNKWLIRDIRDTRGIPTVGRRISVRVPPETQGRPRRRALSLGVGHLANQREHLHGSQGG